MASILAAFWLKCTLMENISAEIEKIEFNFQTHLIWVPAYSDLPWHFQRIVCDQTQTLGLQLKRAETADVHKRWSYKITYTKQNTEQLQLIGRREAHKSRKKKNETKTKQKKKNTHYKLKHKKYTKKSLFIVKSVICMALIEPTDDSIQRFIFNFSIFLSSEAIFFLLFVNCVE